MTFESTTAYYQLLINVGRQRWDDQPHNPVVLILSIDHAEALFSAAAVA